MRHLLVLVAAFVSVASAQTGGDLFPYAVGDRWVYEVEGVAAHNVSPGADTVRARVEWRVEEVREGAPADTVLFRVVRDDAGGGGYETVCGFAVEPGPDAHSLLFPADGAVEGADPYDYWQCRWSSAFPSAAVSYPFIHWPDSTEARGVAIGEQTVVREAGTAWWSYSYCGTPCTTFRRTETRSTLLAGVGQVELEATYGVTDQGTPVRRDTLRARLVGAEVGGVAYGELRPVATEAGPAARPTLHADPSVTTGPVTVRAEASGWLAVFDLSGRRVLTTETAPSGRADLDLRSLPPGLYILRLVTAEGAATARVAVVR
ncbi:T9SS type A sorting domain-containing protein [Rubrivirga marina]|uniref:Secretion system C-terminal sorting domain-containing protein n=1 Tax=Rubrivirga marina TaxID=1196024 RepID=A0A271IZ50_9BACT|nr:T9SS type A sorting domain-containing protein [Rubrivirga marina]PAP76531.1 hypothetical protein BSZ37_08795 [Rubrivirga marina]